MIEITAKGDYTNTLDFLKKVVKGDAFSDLDKYGRMGVEALSRATPKDTGETAQSWDYRITKTSTSVMIEWFNTHRVGETSVAVLVQYGHGTRNGGYIQGRDFINPAMKPVFDKISDEIWKKVKHDSR